MIQVENINMSFENKQVLFDISALFETGKTNLIIGQSGSGKTVLLKSIVGLLTPDNGKISYDGRDFLKYSKDDKLKLRKEIGMLFQGSALFDSLSIKENVLFPLRMFSGMIRIEMEKRAKDCLDMVGLNDVYDNFPSELSGGMQKRAAIARAMALNPKYLFCDEPNSGLDPLTSIKIDSLITEITQEYKITTIINTHDMNSVLTIGDRIVFIYQGRKEWEGASSDVPNTDNDLLHDFVYASKAIKK